MRHVTIEDLPDLVQAKVHRWRGHPDWDDILAESYYEAWKSYVRTSQTGACPPMAGAMLGAARGPSQWQRRWRGDKRHCSRLRLQGTVSLEELAPADYEADECSETPAVASFVPDLVERLWYGWLWERIAAICTPRMVEVLRLVTGGLTMQQVADRLGLSRRGVEYHYYQALARCRERLG